MRVRMCVCACACMCVRVCVRMMRMCAGVRVFYAWVCASRVSFPAHWAHWTHTTISKAYGSGDCQIARSVVMMASADEGRAGGLGRRQNLDNLPAPRQPTRVTV